MQSSTSIESTFPKDIWLEILQKLNTKSLLTFRVTSQQGEELAKQLLRTRFAQGDEEAFEIIKKWMLKAYNLQTNIDITLLENLIRHPDLTFDERIKSLCLMAKQKNISFPKKDADNYFDYALSLLKNWQKKESLEECIIAIQALSVLMPQLKTKQKQQLQPILSDWLSDADHKVRGRAYETLADLCYQIEPESIVSAAKEAMEKSNNANAYVSQKALKALAALAPWLSPTQVKTLFPTLWTKFERIAAAFYINDDVPDAACDVLVAWYSRLESADCFDAANEVKEKLKADNFKKKHWALRSITTLIPRLQADQLQTIMPSLWPLLTQNYRKNADAACAALLACYAQLNGEMFTVAAEEAKTQLRTCEHWYALSPTSEIITEQVLRLQPDQVQGFLPILWEKISDKDHNLIYPKACVALASCYAQLNSEDLPQVFKDILEKLESTDWRVRCGALYVVKALASLWQDDQIETLLPVLWARLEDRNYDADYCIYQAGNKYRVSAAAYEALAALCYRLNPETIAAASTKVIEILNDKEIDSLGSSSVLYRSMLSLLTALTSRLQPDQIKELLLPLSAKLMKEYEVDVTEITCNALVACLAQLNSEDYIAKIEETLKTLQESLPHISVQCGKWPLRLLSALAPRLQQDQIQLLVPVLWSRLKMELDDIGRTAACDALVACYSQLKSENFNEAYKEALAQLQDKNLESKWPLRLLTAIASKLQPGQVQVLLPILGKLEKQNIDDAAALLSRLIVINKEKLDMEAICDTSIETYKNKQTSICPQIIFNFFYQLPSQVKEIIPYKRFKSSATPHTIFDFFGQLTMQLYKAIQDQSKKTPLPQTNHASLFNQQYVYSIDSKTKQSNKIISYKR